MPTCSSCGGNFDDTFQFCPYCGKPTPKPQEPIKVDVVTHEPSSSFDCPKCHRVDNVQRVSAIVQGGTHQINGQIPVSYTSHDSDGWHSGTSYESYHATQQSTIASRLMPPPKPRPGWHLSELLLGISFLTCPFSCLVIATALLSESTPDKPASPIVRLMVLFFGLFMLAIAAGCFFLWLMTKKSRDAKGLETIKKWEDTIHRWNSLYYCSRDDCIFIPGEKSAFPTSSMNDVINWHPSK